MGVSFNFIIYTSNIIQFYYVTVGCRKCFIVLYALRSWRAESAGWGATVIVSL